MRSESVRNGVLQEAAKNMKGSREGPIGVGMLAQFAMFYSGVQML